MNFTHKSPAQSVSLASSSLGSSSHATNFGAELRNSLTRNIQLELARNHIHGPGLTRSRNVYLDPQLHTGLEMVVLQALTLRERWMHCITEAGMSSVNGVAALMTTALAHVSDSCRYF